MAFGQPGVTGDVNVVEEERATLVNRLQGDGWITGREADTAKALGLVAVGFGSNEFAVGGATPKVGAAGLEKGASKDAEGSDELAGIAALKCGPGKLQKKLLEILVRLRRVARTRISSGSCQCAPFVLAKRLKTIELHSKPTLDSQIESREYEGGSADL